MGAIISTQIKSGTNHFHGNVFKFFRNDKLNANSWSIAVANIEFITFQTVTKAA